MTLSRQEIEQKVLEAVCASLALEPEEIKPHTRLVDDLGMDSLDFLDIMFSLEKIFNAKIRDEDFDRALRPEKADPGRDNKFLNGEEIARLAPFIADLHQEAQTRQIRRTELFSFFTLESLVIMVEQKITRPEQDEQ